MLAEKIREASSDDRQEIHSSVTKIVNDCIKPKDELMSAEAAITELKRSAVVKVAKQKVPLKDAAGRVLAEEIVGTRDVPGFDNAAVDGYAFAYIDYKAAAGSALPVSEYIRAGRMTDHALAPGTVARIFTGAKIPDGADTVVMQEDVKLASEKEIVLPEGVDQGINYRKRGEDVRKDQPLYKAGERLSPFDTGMLAAFGYSEVSVYCPLKVAVFSTGDEIIEPGDPLAADGVYDVNRYMLQALLNNMGCHTTDLGILKDDKQTIGDALENAARQHQVIITSGGVSTGDADHIADILKEVGDVGFWRLAIKPGRPLAFGKLYDKQFIGFPGNPVATAVCFLRFAYPLLATFSGQNWPEPKYLDLPSAFSMRKKTGRREWVRARLVAGEKGVVSVDKHPKQGSGVLTSMVEADGLVELSEEQIDIKPGDRLSFMPFSQFGF